MDRREAIERLQALIRDVRKAGTSQAALARLEDALDKLLQEDHDVRA